MRVPVIRNVSVSTSNHTSGWFVDKEETNPHMFFFYIECVCNSWFTIEILVSADIYPLWSHLWDGMKGK
jgi:potassium voltage-gated channel Shaw-related subfamily C member 1